MSSPSKIASEFDRVRYDHAYPEGVENNYWNIARNRIIAREIGLAERTGLIPTRPRILEVGCGPGVVVKHLTNAGIDAWGVDLGRPIPVKGTEGRLFTGITADALPKPYRLSIDCLMLLDVIEHIEDAGAFLRGTLASFSNARAALVTVPARPEAWSNFDDYYGHYRRYTMNMLQQELSACEMTPVRIRYFFHSLYFAAMGIKFARLQRGVVLQPPGSIPFHRGLAEYLWLESKLLGSLRFVPGLSLLAVARR
jgi:hypothetical protein